MNLKFINFNVNTSAPQLVDFFQLTLFLLIREGHLFLVTCLKGIHIREGLSLEIRYLPETVSKFPS